MSVLRLDIPEFLNRCKIALDNTKQMADISTAMAVYGYDETRLQEGWALLEQAEGLYASQKREYGEQYAATEALNKAREAADALYSVHRKLAQLALKDNLKQQDALGLTAHKKQSYSGWLTQAIVFYSNILQDVSAHTAMARFNITLDKLNEGQALVQQVLNLQSTQAQEKYEAQQATKDRDAALDALDAWMMDFQEIAKIALSDKPQQLEALKLAVVA